VIRLLCFIVSILSVDTVYYSIMRIQKAQAENGHKISREAVLDHGERSARPNRGKVRCIVCSCKGMGS
jgi:hypothetical protein